MTQLLSHDSQSFLGETCAFYLASFKDKFPTSLNAIQDKFITAFSAETPLSLRSLGPPPTWITENTFAADKFTLAVTILACALAVAIMSWRSPFTNLFRRSPQYSTVSNTPQVSDSDYSYIVDGAAGTYRNQDDNAPDTLLLKHKRNAYELNFPAYAINDGTLSVRELRRRAAEATGAPDPKRVKLLYKGKLLDDDDLPCRDEGLKQQSEVLCVVSEVGESTPSEGSDAEDKASDSAPPDDAPRPKRVRNRNKSKKNKNKKKNKDGADTLPSSADQTPSASPGRSTLPAPAPNLKAFSTPLEQAQALSAYFQRELLPLCDEYIANTPADPKSREFEHAKLSETILAQVILRADGIEPDGNVDARNARKALVKEAQSTLTKLDQAKA
ncbi:BAG domain protein [Aspergillus bombycis]|uniref:BAG domain protein n=1 Tax=Aspergillus bombycis TaxID=109264 RepID=A0A1F7ZU94_9EURO|nr:BAG domain protein [Aspergillus bombycis]OGM43010.1 BAG domain protein [Aspergillus bombycis]